MSKVWLWKQKQNCESWTAFTVEVWEKKIVNTIAPDEKKNCEFCGGKHNIETWLWSLNRKIKLSIWKVNWEYGMKLEKISRKWRKWKMEKDNLESVNRLNCGVIEMMKRDWNDSVLKRLDSWLNYGYELWRERSAT